MKQKLKAAPTAHSYWLGFLGCVEQAGVRRQGWCCWSHEFEGVPLDSFQNYGGEVWNRLAFVVYLVLS